MDLSDPSKASELIGYIDEELGPESEWFRTIPNDGKLKLIDGHPGVFDHWIDGEPKNEQDLIRLAKEAVEYQYTDLEKRIETLATDSNKRPQLNVCIRHALRPRGPDITPALAPVVCDKTEPLDAVDNAVADLMAEGILVEQNPPSFGHERRWFAAVSCITKIPKVKPYVHSNLKHLIVESASRHNRIDSSQLPFSVALVTLRRYVENLPEYAGLCDAAIILHDSRGEIQFDPVNLLKATEIALADQRVAPLVAMGLTNSFKYTDEAVPEERSQAFEKIIEKWPYDERVIDSYTRALTNCVKRTEGESRQEILKRFRRLCDQIPTSRKARDWYCHVLFIQFRQSDADSSRVLLDELHEVVAIDPDDVILREKVASSLVKHLTATVQVQADLALASLKSLTNTYADDSSVCGQYACALRIVAFRDDGEMLDENLQELRRLHAANAENRQVHDQLVNALGIAALIARERLDTARADEFESELWRQLETLSKKEHRGASF